MPPVLGIHHVSAIAGEPQLNYDFCTRVLGMRLVKKTVNFDAPGAYHLYYGDAAAAPGSILTYFPLGRHGVPGVIGAGQVSATAFCIRPDSLDAWHDRLEASLVRSKRVTRLGDEILELTDPDGVRLEIVESNDAPDSDGLARFHSATLCSQAADATARLLEEMGYAVLAEEGSRSRWKLDAGVLPSQLDLVGSPAGIGSRVARGTVHHIALGVRDAREQEGWRERLLEIGYHVSPVMERQYFQSIYFRERGGILFELATLEPGFTADEPLEQLGSALKLPPWLEETRATIEAGLPPLET